MRSVTDRIRIAFIHLPKTGGTSLHNFLVTHFPEERVCPERFNNFDQFSEAELHRYDYFSGHMDFRNLRRVANPAYTITILREPKARILSLYYFWRAHTDDNIEQNNLEGPRLAKRLRLLDFLNWQEDGVPSVLNNLYARSLIGENETAPDGGLVLGDAEALETALRNLWTLDEIGFMDDMPGLFARVCRHLNLKAPDVIPKDRSSGDFGRDPGTEPVIYEKITPEIDAQLDDLVRLDRIIYETARTWQKAPQ